MDNQKLGRLIETSVFGVLGVIFLGVGLRLWFESDHFYLYMFSSFFVIFAVFLFFHALKRAFPEKFE